MNIKKAMVAVLPVLAALGLSACASTDLENTTYRLIETDTYTDIDLDVSLTVTDLTDDEAADGSYSRTCMIQFSGDDCEEYLEYVKDYWVYNQAGTRVSNEDTTDLDAMDQNREAYIEYYDNTIDIKSQFMDNACKCYVYYDEDGTDDEMRGTIYTHLDGAEDDFYFEIFLDSDGTLLVLAFDDYMCVNQDTFHK